MLVENVVEWKVLPIADCIHYLVEHLYSVDFPLKLERWPI